MDRNRILIAIITALLLPLDGLSAESHEEDAGVSPGAAYQRNLAFVGDRAVQLAEAIPSDDYGWRPMEGVRTVSEAIMHTASANYFFAGRLGHPAPEGVDVGGFEKITDKEQCVSALRDSVAHLDAALGQVSDPAAKIDLFGREGTVEDLLLVAIGHVHEHFGQLIAYARSNEVVPPWSQ